MHPCSLRSCSKYYAWGSALLLLVGLYVSNPAESVPYLRVRSVAEPEGCLATPRFSTRGVGCAAEVGCW